MKDFALGCISVLIGMFLGAAIVLVSIPLLNAGGIQPTPAPDTLLPDRPAVSVTASAAFMNSQMQPVLRQSGLASQATITFAAPNLIRFAAPMRITLLGQPIQVNAMVTMSIVVKSGRTVLTVEQVEANGLTVPREVVPAAIETMRAQSEDQVNRLIQRSLQGTGLRVINIRISPDAVIVDLSGS
jgi:hypothetical protein